VAKRRIVLDGDIDNPNHEAMSLLARLLWDRLWKTCDFFGRERWRADVLKILCFPEDKRVEVKHILKVMEEIEEESDLVFIYSAGERQFYQLVDWEKAFKGEHRGDSSIPKPPEGAGKQARLTVPRTSTEKTTKTPPEVKVKVKDKVIVEDESPAGEKHVDKQTRRTEKEVREEAEKYLDSSWDERKNLSPRVQEAIKDLVKKKAMFGEEGSRREKLTDEQICERLNISAEELKHKRSIGITEIGGVLI